MLYEVITGAIYPVYQLMKDTGHDVNWSDYLQPVLSYYMNADGQLMSMPFNSSTPVMFYNVDQFDVITSYSIHYTKLYDVPPQQVDKKSGEAENLS